MSDQPHRTLTEFDHQMIAVAKRRGIIRLQDGTLATLITWGTPRRPSNVRVEGCNGKTRWTVKKRNVIEVVQ